MSEKAKITLDENKPVYSIKHLGAIFYRVQKWFENASHDCDLPIKWIFKYHAWYPIYILKDKCV